MAVEEIEMEDNPRGEEGAKIGLPKKKMTKKDAPSSSATSSRSTLTRFLGPSGPPSRALWEDINRQCPVCQRKGFSSRALALHVNECLDVGLREHDDGDGDGASAVREHARTRAPGDVQEETTGAGSKPTAGASRAQKAVKVAKRDSVPARVLADSNAQATSSDAAKVPPKIVSVSKKPSKKAKIQAIQKPVHESTTQKDSDGPEPGVSRIDREHTRQVRVRAQPTQAISKTAMSSPSGSTSKPTLERPHGVLARAREHDPTTDATLGPAEMVAGTDKGGEGRARLDITRAQLTLVVGNSAQGAQNAGWVGTRLFPSPTREDDVIAHDGFATRKDHENGPRSNLASSRVGEVEERPKQSLKGARSRRVRPRPASWGARSCDEHNGTWRDCPHWDYWGDGDGYLTLRPFPASEESAGSDATVEDGEEDRPIDGNRADSVHLEDVAPLSRADRFLQVFELLQPARLALNLEEAMPAPRSGERSGGYGKLQPPSNAVVREQKTTDVRTDTKTAPARCSTPAPQIESNAADTRGCFPNQTAVKAQGTRDAELKHLQTVEDVTSTKAASNKHEANKQVEHRNCSPNIRDAARSPQPDDTSSKTTIVPDPSGISSQRNLPDKTSSEQIRIGERSQTSLQMVDLTSEASSPPTPAAGKNCSPLDCPLGPHEFDSRGGDRGSSSPDESSPARDALLKRARDGVDVEAAGPNRAKLSFPLQGVAGVPPYLSPAARGAASLPAALQVSPLSPGATRPSLLERSPAVANGLQPTLGQISGTIVDDGENGSTYCLGRKNVVRGGAAKPDVNRAIPSTSKTVSRLRGKLSYRASSGVLRSADVRQDPKSSGDLDPRSTLGKALARNERATSILRNSSSAAAVADTASGVCGGRVADVAQTGSLTVVDPHHGATLRSSWSIDHSEDLGRLEFGTTLNYDAVWCYPPADEECVAVLRYHIVPHPVWAPKGGWISERGRLRDDPYIIAKATPASIPTQGDSNGEARTASSRRISDPFRQRENLGSAALECRSEARPSRIVHGNGGQEAHNRAAGVTISRKSALATDSYWHRTLASPSPGVRVQPGKPNTLSPPVERTPPRQNKPNVRAGSGASAEPPTKSTSTAGRFGFSTSSSAKLLEANDTGDRVKCPICNQGMDHWPQARRNQHAHNCMLRNSSASKKQASTMQGSSCSSCSKHINAAQGSTKQTKGLPYGDGGVAAEVEPRGSRVPQEFRRHKPSDAGRMEERMTSAPRSGLPGVNGSPREPKMSLQGVFSPKRKASGRGLVDDAGSRKLRNNTPRRGPFSTFEPDAPHPTTSNTTSGLKPEVVSRAMKDCVSVANEFAASEGRQECPICRLSFAGRQGQWERDAHIQQCLESLTLEGAFDLNDD